MNDSHAVRHPIRYVNDRPLLREVVATVVGTVIASHILTGLQALAR